MAIKVAINGFGRIGRLSLRALLESEDNDIEVVAINDLADLKTNAHLLKYDSAHGRMPFDVSCHGDVLQVDDRQVKVYAEPDPKQLPWAEHDVDVVWECTGRFTTGPSAGQHLEAGAKHVVISAPAKDVDRTVVCGVNHQTITASDKIISNGSCTTNCLAPIAKTLHKAFGIKHGYMTTIHAYTGDQRLVDTAHTDLHRARAAALSMIPTTTGAAKAVGLVLPELAGKLDGTAIRVPTANVSMVDFKFVPNKAITTQNINMALEQATSNELHGILAVTKDPLVSVDFNHSAHSATVALPQTQVVEEMFGRVMAWYDNEWGFSNRMADVTRHLMRVV